MCRRDLDELSPLRRTFGLEVCDSHVVRRIENTYTRYSSKPHASAMDCYTPLTWIECGYSLRWPHFTQLQALEKFSVMHSGTSTPSNEHGLIYRSKPAGTQHSLNRLHAQLGYSGSFEEPSPHFCRRSRSSPLGRTRYHFDRTHTQSVRFQSKFHEFIQMKVSDRSRISRAFVEGGWSS